MLGLSCRLVRWWFRVVRWLRRCPLRGGGRWSGLRWRPVRRAGVSGRRVGRFPVRSSSPVSAVLRRRPRLLRLGLAGWAFRWPSGGFVVPLGRSLACRCLWLARRLCRCPLRRRCLPSLAGCGPLRWLCRRCRCWSPAWPVVGRAGLCAAVAARWPCGAAPQLSPPWSAAGRGPSACRRCGPRLGWCSSLPPALRRSRRSRCASAGLPPLPLLQPCRVFRCPSCRVAGALARPLVAQPLPCRCASSRCFSVGCSPLGLETKNPAEAGLAELN